MGECCYIVMDGFGLSEDCWAPLSTALSAHGRIVRLSQALGPRGFDDMAPDAETAARHVAECLSHLSVEKATLVAWCLGCRLALAVADVAPDQVDMLVLLAPALSMRREDRQPDPTNRLMVALGSAADSAKGRLLAMVRMLSTGTADEPSRNRWLSHLATLTEVELERYVRLYVGWQKYETHAPLGRFRHPVLVIGGTRDDMVPFPWLSSWVAAWLPHAALSSLNGDHYFFQTSADETARLVTAARAERDNDG